MARLDWETLLREKLLPLIGEMRLRSGRRHSKTAS
jgi:hypothetical protein